MFLSRFHQFKAHGLLNGANVIVIGIAVLALF